MKKTICVAVFGISFLLMLGIVGGMECGQPLSNALWLIPLLGASGVSAWIGGSDK